MTLLVAPFAQENAMNTPTTIAKVLPGLVSIDAKKVLDVGSGIGGLMRSLAKQGAEAHGIEPNPANVAICQDQDPAHQDNYQVAGAENMPYGDGEFDVVVFSNSLHHVPPGLQAAGLSEAARVLKPGGHAIIAEPVPQGAHFNMSLPIEDETEVRNHALAAILDTTDHGLEIVQETSFISASPYASFEDFHVAMIQVDPAREQAFINHGDLLRENYAKYARMEGTNSVFDQEIRVHVLRKS